MANNAPVWNHVGENVNYSTEKSDNFNKESVSGGQQASNQQTNWQVRAPPPPQLRRADSQVRPLNFQPQSQSWPRPISAPQSQNQDLQRPNFVTTIRVEPQRPPISSNQQNSFGQRSSAWNLLRQKLPAEIIRRPQGTVSGPNIFIGGRPQQTFTHTHPNLPKMQNPNQMENITNPQPSANIGQIRYPAPMQGTRPLSGHGMPAPNQQQTQNFTPSMQRMTMMHRPDIPNVRGPSPEMQQHQQFRPPAPMPGIRPMSGGPQHRPPILKADDDEDVVITEASLSHNQSRPSSGITQARPPSSPSMQKPPYHTDPGRPPSGRAQQLTMPPVKAPLPVMKPSIQNHTKDVESSEAKVQDIIKNTTENFKNIPPTDSRPGSNTRPAPLNKQLTEQKLVNDNVTKHEIINKDLSISESTKPLVSEKNSTNPSIAQNVNDLSAKKDLQTANTMKPVATESVAQSKLQSNLVMQDKEIKSNNLPPTTVPTNVTATVNGIKSNILRTEPVRTTLYDKKPNDNPVEEEIKKKMVVIENKPCSDIKTEKLDEKESATLIRPSSLKQTKVSSRPETPQQNGVTEDSKKKDSLPNGQQASPKKTPNKLPTPKKPGTNSAPMKSPSKPVPKTPETPNTAEKKKLPMNKIQVGSAPSPNIKVVKSKIGSLENYTHKPGGGKIKIETKKIAFANVQSRINAKNDTYTPGGGDKKITQVKLQWNAKPKVGSLDNATHKPGGGDKKIGSVKLDFKEKAKPKIGSKDNIKHIPGGGQVKSSACKEREGNSTDIEDQKIELKVQSKIGSLDNVKHRPGGGDKKIFDDKEYLKQMTAMNSESISSSHERLSRHSSNASRSKSIDRMKSPTLTPSTPDIESQNFIIGKENNEVQKPIDQNSNQLHNKKVIPTEIAEKVTATTTDKDFTENKTNDDENNTKLINPEMENQTLTDNSRETKIISPDLENISTSNADRQI